MELFEIHSIYKSNVIAYRIKDLNDEIIKGIFYEKTFKKQKILQKNILLKKY